MVLHYFLGPLTNSTLTIDGIFNFYGPLTNKQLSINGPLTNKELNIDGPLTNNILNIDGPLTNKPYHFSIRPILSVPRNKDAIYLTLYSSPLSTLR